MKKQCRIYPAWVLVNGETTSIYPASPGPHGAGSRSLLYSEMQLSSEIPKAARGRTQRQHPLLWLCGAWGLRGPGSVWTGQALRLCLFVIFPRRMQLWIGTRLNARSLRSHRCINSHRDEALSSLHLCKFREGHRPLTAAFPPRGAPFRSQPPQGGTRGAADVAVPSLIPAGAAAAGWDGPWRQRPSLPCSPSAGNQKPVPLRPRGGWAPSQALPHADGAGSSSAQT